MGQHGARVGVSVCAIESEQCFRKQFLEQMLSVRVRRASPFPPLPPWLAALFRGAARVATRLAGGLKFLSKTLFLSPLFFSFFFFPFPRALFCAYSALQERTGRWLGKNHSLRGVEKTHLGVKKIIYS